MLLRLTLTALLLVPQSARPATQDVLDRELLRSYFAVCDADGNGWLSFRECRDSLSLDRAAYAGFDTNRDLRVDPEEFSENYAEVTRRVGVLPAPRSTTVKPVDLPRVPTQLLAAYDRNNDSALQKSEIMKLFEDYGRQDLPIDTALANLDTNGDGSLSGGELERASRLLSSLTVVGRAPIEPALTPGSLDELFGKTVPRPRTIDASPQPPLIVGPVLPFRRLDLDGDGGIVLDDLFKLMSPLNLDIRLAAIHAALDLNEDGRLDRDELAASFGVAALGEPAGR